ncbi:unnamed protein product [Arctogadus glacialis]
MSSSFSCQGFKSGLEWCQGHSHAHLNGFWMNRVSCCPKLKLSKTLAEVDNQLVNKVNKRSLISLTLDLLHCWEVCTLSLQVFFEHLKFPLEGADSCHEVTN